MGYATPYGSEKGGLCAITEHTLPWPEPCGSCAIECRGARVPDQSAGKASQDLVELHLWQALLVQDALPVPS